MSTVLHSLTSEEIIAALDDHADRLRQLGAVRIGVFGSRRRGDTHAGSDLDILIRLARPSFNAYMDIRLYLEDLFGCRVDLVLEDSLRPELRDGILAEAIYATRL
jgi:hypothetical protein